MQVSRRKSQLGIVAIATVGTDVLKDYKMAWVVWMLTYPVEVTRLRMQLAVVFILSACAATSSSLNGMFIYVFASIGVRNLPYKDALVFSMSIGDLLQSLLGYSLELYASSKRGEAGLNTESPLCKVAAFTITFLALSSTAHLTALAYDRYMTICRPFRARRIHDSYVLCTALILSCWIYGFAWAVFPFMGWSGYELEKDDLRCSIAWASKTMKDHIYIILLFLSCFILPIAVMCYSFIRVKRELSKMQLRASNLFGRESKAAKDNVRAERRHTKLAVVMCAVFIVTWVPYSLLSFWASFFMHIAEFPAVLATVAAIVAKSSTMFNPIIYIVMHKGFRRAALATPFGKALCCTLDTKRWPRRSSSGSAQQSTWL